jgi:hypothetical protein
LVIELLFTILKLSSLTQLTGDPEGALKTYRTIQFSKSSGLSPENPFPIRGQKNRAADSSLRFRPLRPSLLSRLI